MRPATLLLLPLAAGAVAALYFVAHQVAELDQRLAELNAGIEADHNAVRVLHAEFAHLTRPQRLQALAARHLDLAPLRGDQLVPRDGLPETGPQIMAMDASDGGAVQVDLPPRPRPQLLAAHIDGAAQPSAARRPLDAVADLMAGFLAFADAGGPR